MGSSASTPGSVSPGETKPKTGPTGVLSDTVISLPTEKVEQSGGFALDIGSSVAKVIYRSNKEYKNGVKLEKSEDPERGTVHYALFHRYDVDSVIDYLKDHCDLKRNEEGIAEVHGSGSGNSLFKKRLQEELSAKLTIVGETDTFPEAFYALTKIYSREELLHPLPAEVVAKAEAQRAEMQKFIQLAEEAGNTLNVGLETKVDEEPEEAEGENTHLPCLLAMCGSGTGFFKVEKDGSHLFLEGPFTAGRFFYGLGSYLGETNDFEKLLEMAGSVKDHRSMVDTYSDDMVTQTEEEGEDDEEKDPYSFMPMSVILFPFGKAGDMKKKDIKKEDVVLSAYNSVATLHAQFAFMISEMTNIKRVYFCGNLFNNELGRELILERKGLRDSYTPPEKSCDFQFIKNGGMLGVLGAFMKNPGETAPQGEH